MDQTPSDTTTVRTDYEHQCDGLDSGASIRDVLDRVGDKWSLLVIGTLTAGPLRFGELRQHIPGVSQRMLTRTVRHLERDGLVTRTSFAQVPPRVEYALTPMGRTLVEPSSALARWAISNQDHIAAARADYDARQ
ncbi:MAG: winged helix-turn-helix transcriptional regulator [Beutenbergiaceae bacterium]